MKQNNTILSFIPNTITSLNVFSGCIAITLSFNGYLEWAAYFIFIAAVFDFFDGFTARLLNAYSQLGKELDSLADIVSFGVAPASMVYKMMIRITEEAPYTEFLNHYLPLAAFLIVIFSALRLAKFNIDERQNLTFIGLATPPNAIFFASLIFIPQSELLGWMLPCLHNYWVLLGLVLIFCYLLIAEIPMFSLKIKTKNISDYKIQFIFLAFALVLLISLQLAAISLIAIVYILLSIINNFSFKQK